MAVRSSITIMALCLLFNTASPLNVVAGATGKVGRELVRVLRRQSVPHLVLTRNIIAAKRLLGVQTVCREVDLDVLDKRLDDALDFEGPFQLFVACANGPNHAANEARLLQAAAATGRCSHVVKISTTMANIESTSAHLEGEAKLRELHNSWTVLRPNVFVETLVTPASPFLGASEMKHALANTPIAMISIRDVAAVAARILISDAPKKNETLELSGPEAVKLAEVMGTCGIHVAPQSIDAHFSGVPSPVAEPMRAFFDACLNGDCAKVTADTERSLGEPPRRAADVFARELTRRALDSGDDVSGYNGRGVWTANYRKHLCFDEIRRKVFHCGCIK